MKLEKKRIFIKELPNKSNESDLQTTFSDYGNVISVEIKTRKDTNTNKRFAYVNIEADNFNLQKCFKDFSQNRWFGEFVELQIAKENFLERLKREREESANTTTPKPEPLKNVELETNPNTKLIPRSGTKFNNKKVYNSDSSDEGSDNENCNKSTPKEEEEEKGEQDILVIKNNKLKLTGNQKVLKIPERDTPNHRPTPKADEIKIEKSPFTSKSDHKRLESIKKMRENYKQQKSLIQTSLANIDNRPKNKIIFKEEENRENNDGDKKINYKKKKELFDNHSDNEDTYNFHIKKQFEGIQGQKLLELKSKYKNDKRFELDERFIDDDEDKNEENSNSLHDENEDERTKQFHILGEILDSQFLSKDEFDDNNTNMGMVKYDPFQPQHSKYEVKSSEKENNENAYKEKEWKKKKVVQIEAPLPTISKETHYQIRENLKDKFKEKESFSLLSMFGRHEDINYDEDEEMKEELPQNSLENNKTVEYESSDNDEDMRIEYTEKHRTTEEKRQQPKSWHEPFFYQKDDYRFQEGFDFVKKIVSDLKDEQFKEIQDIKKTVKSKIKNNIKNKKPFKTKLGGNKQKRLIRMKKAIKKG